MTRKFKFILLPAIVLPALVLAATFLTSSNYEPGKVCTTQTLDTPIPAEINCINTPLSTTLDLIVTLTNQKLKVDWDTLKASGITRDSPVIVRLLNVKASKAINTILNDVGGGNVKLTWFLENDGTVLITTADNLVQTHSVIKTYDISDIIADPDSAKRSENLRVLVTSLDFDGRRNSPDDAKWNSFHTRESSGMITVKRLPGDHAEIPGMLQRLRQEHLANGVTLSDSTVLDDWRADHDTRE
jgi:hypothetical protein